MAPPSVICGATALTAKNSDVRFRSITRCQWARSISEIFLRPTSPPVTCTSPWIAGPNLAWVAATSAATASGSVMSPAMAKACPPFDSISATALFAPSPLAK